MSDVSKAQAARNKARALCSAYRYLCDAGADDLAALVQPASRAAKAEAEALDAALPEWCRLGPLY